MIHWKPSHLFATRNKSMCASIWTEYDVRACNTFGIKANCCCACAKAYSNCFSAPALSWLLTLMCFDRALLYLFQVVLINYHGGSFEICYMLINTHGFCSRPMRMC